MTRLFYFRAAMVIMAVVAISVAASVPMAQAAPPPEAATASGGTVPQSGNCPAGRQQDEHCLPGGPGNPPAGLGGPIHPPVMPPVPPPVTPPVTLPIVSPPGIPSATRPQDRELPPFIFGSAIATLHIHDDDHDIIYTSEEVPLTFLRRFVQDMPGNTQYILTPLEINQVPNPREEVLPKLQMIWTAEGREFDCTVKGKAIVSFPGIPDPNIGGGGTYLDPTENPTGNITQPAYGYLNVVGPDGGDFHSVMIKAFNPDARLIKTCPGNPPLVTEENFQAGFLLHILTQPNTHEDGRVIFQGHQEYDQGDPLDFLNLLPPGAAIPEVAR